MEKHLNCHFREIESILRVRLILCLIHQVSKVFILMHQRSFVLTDERVFVLYDSISCRVSVISIWGAMMFLLGCVRPGL